jgi:hypothetical protein
MPSLLQETSPRWYHFPYKAKVPLGWSYSGSQWRSISGYLPGARCTLPRRGIHHRAGEIEFVPAMILSHWRLDSLHLLFPHHHRRLFLAKGIESGVEDCLAVPCAKLAPGGMGVQCCTSSWIHTDCHRARRFLRTSKALSIGENAEIQETMT